MSYFLVSILSGRFVGIIKILVFSRPSGCTCFDIFRFLFIESKNDPEIPLNESVSFIGGEFLGNIIYKS